MHDTTKSFSCATEDVDLVRLAKRLLQRANLGLIGAFSKTTATDLGADVFATADASTTKTRILRLAGVTAGGGENEAICCLVEVVLPSAPSSSGTLRVQTEAITLGLQLADEFADCLSSLD